ncbi:hypothetical protein RSP799_21425 [Ralstonia solanacearum]|nr:hypothetical protein RSP799_21425 [Ralstonia solanacearum]
MCVAGERRGGRAGIRHGGREFLNDGSRRGLAGIGIDGGKGGQRCGSGECKHGAAHRRAHRHGGRCALEG